MANLPLAAQRLSAQPSAVRPLRMKTTVGSIRKAREDYPRSRSSPYGQRAIKPYLDRLRRTRAGVHCSECMRISDACDRFGISNGSLGRCELCPHGGRRSLSRVRATQGMGGYADTFTRCLSPIFQGPRRTRDRRRGSDHDYRDDGERHSEGRQHTGGNYRIRDERRRQGHRTSRRRRYGMCDEHRA